MFIMNHGAIVIFKKLLKRLNEATDQLQYKNQGSNPHTISTIKFEREEFESNANYSKRQNLYYEDIHKQQYQANTLKQGNNGINNILEQISMIDNTKTSRNNPILKFNPSKSRKKSENSHDRQLKSKRQPTTRRDKKDLIEVRDKLNDIISFLNRKIESNPEVSQIEKIVNTEEVKQSLSFKNESNTNHKQLSPVNKSNDVLYLPRYQLTDARLDKSTHFINHHTNDNNNEYLNLKHSFDKLNDIVPQSNCQVQKSRFVINHTQQQFPRNNLHVLQPIQRAHNFNKVPINQRRQIKEQHRPVIFINGRRLNDSVSQNNSDFIPIVKSTRPFSENPQLRSINRSPIYYQQNTNKLITNPLINNSPPINLNHIPSKYPNALNIGPPSFRRIIASRPFSTNRSNTQPKNYIQRQQKTPIQQIIPIKRQQQRRPQIKNNPIPTTSQQESSKSRLKKMTSFGNLFKQPILTQSKNISDNTIIDSNTQQIPMAKEELEQILPSPKPYQTFSTNIQNPFKKRELSASKQSQRIKAQVTNDALQSIAQQSEQNHLTKNMQSGKSSERMMSSVNSNFYLSKVNKFQGGGSTKLKRKGIDISSKQIYMSQYNRRP